MAEKKTTKENKDVFVIMPFTSSPTRSESQLTSFFKDQLKKQIEGGNFQYQYTVSRSDDTFNINEKIIKDIYHADIVICDLSGIDGNPNVMYELGIRLAISKDPVIIIRERHKANNPIFDIGGFHTQPYDPLNFSDLFAHIEGKIKKFESREEKYESPVLKIVGQEIPLLEKMSRKRANNLLGVMYYSVSEVQRLFVMKLVSNDNINASKFDFGNNYEDVITKIDEKLEQFLNIDLSEFIWRSASNPTIDSYLANQYLYNLLDEKIVTPFTAYLLKYHVNFLGTDVFHSSWESRSVRGYLGETDLLVSMIKLVGIALEQDSIENLNEIAVKVREIHNLSKLSKF